MTDEGVPVGMGGFAEQEDFPPTRGGAELEDVALASPQSRTPLEGDTEWEEKGSERDSSAPGSDAGQQRSPHGHAAMRPAFVRVRSTTSHGKSCASRAKEKSLG